MIAKTDYSLARTISELLDFKWALDYKTADDFWAAGDYELYSQLWFFEYGDVSTYLDYLPDWTTKTDVALELLDKYGTGGPFIIRYNPMTRQYTCWIADMFGATVANEYGPTAALAICNAWVTWKRSAKKDGTP